MSEWAYTVIGTNVVIDCETVEEAVAYMDRLAATPAPLMSKGEADARIDLMKMTKQRDDLLEALAATPAPLDVLVAARAVVDAWEETVTATVISRTNWAIERLRYALATPAPLDVEREALRRQHLEETHRASGSCPGWTCPTARVLALLMEPKP